MKMPSDYAKKKAKAKKEAAKVKGGKKVENVQRDLEASSARNSEEKDKNGATAAGLTDANGQPRKETAEGKNRKKEIGKEKEK